MNILINMNLPYFFEPVISMHNHTLSEETSKHCVQVLRMKENEKLQLTDGKGNLFTAIITSADKKNCEVRIEEIINYKRTTSNISIAISLLKNPTRLEWFMEKATEIGITEIIPLICAHTEKENFRYERMNNIIISAMLQSKQTWLPELQQPKKFETFINEEFNGLKLIAHCADEKKEFLNVVIDPAKNKLILIGPEGDFSQSEINAALANNFIAVNLGNTRLRTETAGIVAVTLLHV